MSMAPEEAHQLALTGLQDLRQQLEFDAALASRIAACFSIAGHPDLKVTTTKIQHEINESRRVVVELLERFKTMEGFDEESGQRDGHLFPGDAVETPGGGVGTEVQSD